MSRKDAIDLAHLGVVFVLVLGFAWGQSIYPMAFTVWSLSLVGIGATIPSLRIWMRSHLGIFFLPFDPVIGSLVIFGEVLKTDVFDRSGFESESVKIGIGWLGVILLTLPLAFLSGSGGSAGGWTDQLREWFNLTPDQADLAVKIIRKTIHFCAYGTIAMTAYLATRSIQKGKPAIIVALVWGCAHGAFDELRQAQTPGRQGRIEDFMVDLAGMIVFLAVTHWLCNNRDKTATNES
jgi:VanZ family protein